MVFTRSRIFFILMVVMFLSGAVGSFNLYGLDILRVFVAEVNEYITVCTASERYILGYTIHLWVDFLSYSVIPSCIIVFCNVCIIYKVCLSKKRWQHGEEHSSRVASMTASLVVIFCCLSHFALLSSYIILI